MLYSSREIDALIEQYHSMACLLDTSCPVRALEFGTLAELRERHPEGVSALGELTDETAPAVVFAPHRDAAKGGVLHNPQEVSHEA